MKNKNLHFDNYLFLNILISQWTIALFAICLELFCLYFFKDGLHRFSEESHIRAYLLEYGNDQYWLATHIFPILKNIFYVLLSVLIVMSITESQAKYFYELIIKFQIRLKPSLVNLISFSCLLWVLMAISDPRPLIANPHSYTSYVYTASPALWFIYFWNIIDCVFPLKSLIQWACRNLLITFFLIAVTLLTFYPGLSDQIVLFWSSLLLDPTLDIALALDHWFGLTVELFPSGQYGPVFGTSQFQVEIWPACSGYEGMALIIALLFFYFYLRRDFLRISRAFLIIPLAGIAMFFLAILIAIGHYYSPELALNGFHIVGGWLNLLLVFASSLVVLNSSSYFSKNSKTLVSGRSEELYFLLPLIALIIGGLFTKIFESNFSWLYPIPMSIVASIIFFYRKWFKFLIEKISFLAYIIGILVFLLWIYLIPIDQTKNQIFFQQLNSASLWISLLWLTFRVVGAVVIVPIAEELAFRGFLLPCLQVWIKNFFTKNVLFKLSVNHIYLISAFLSLIITSLLFGILHSDILAGSLAGLAFGLAYLYKRKLIDAIVAHSVTNALLAINVLYFGNWSYW